MGYVYSLTLGDGHVRYIGQSVVPKERFAKLTNPHFPNAKGPLLRQWLERNIGLVRMVVVEKCSDMNSRERYWIDRCRQEGHALLNIQPGGRNDKKYWKRHPETMAAILESWKTSRFRPDPEDVRFLRELIRLEGEKAAGRQKKKRKRRRRSAQQPER